MPGDAARLGVLVRQLQGEAVHAVGGSGEPAFGANWSNAGGGFLPAGFYRSGERVFLQGTLAKSSAALIGDVMFTLPVAYRPAAECAFGVQSNAAFGRVDVLPTGEVEVIVGNAASVSLDGISFRVA